MKKEAIIDNIEKLKTITQEPNLAYALRVKIFRQTIKLLQRVSEFLDFPKPDRLEEIKKKYIHFEIKDICLSYNSVVKTALSLSQPSEALDDKWGFKWNNFLNELEKLKQAITNKENTQC